MSQLLCADKCQLEARHSARYNKELYLILCSRHI